MRGIEYYVDYSWARCCRCGNFHKTKWVKRDVCEKEWREAFRPIEKRVTRFDILGYILITMTVFAFSFVLVFKVPFEDILEDIPLEGLQIILMVLAFSILYFFTEGREFWWKKIVQYKREKEMNAASSFIRQGYKIMKMSDEDISSGHNARKKANSQQVPLT